MYAILTKPKAFNEQNYMCTFSNLTNPLIAHLINQSMYHGCRPTVLGLIDRMNQLSHRGRDKMYDIFHTTFPNAFFWMQIFEFRIQFDRSVFLRVQLTTIQHWFGNFLAPNRRQAIIWTNDSLGWWRIYASLVVCCVFVWFLIDRFHLHPS